MVVNLASISSHTVKEGNYCSRVMKEYFNKELGMTKEDDTNFESLVKCLICYNTFEKGNVKVRDHCHTTGKYRGADIVKII